MSVSYDVFSGAFLEKIKEYEFLQLTEEDRTATVDGYMKRAISQFRKNCKYDFLGSADDDVRSFDVDIAEDDLEELADIISEGMVVQWFKPYVNHADNLENVLNTRDFSRYSPAELLKEIRKAYDEAKADYTQMIREYSYVYGDLTSLHL